MIHDQLLCRKVNFNGRVGTVVAVYLGGCKPKSVRLLVMFDSGRLLDVQAADVVIVTE